MVLRAIRERRTVVAGPLRLVQGGTGIIGRTPIFVPEPARDSGTGDDDYWGIAATVISFDRLIDGAGPEPTPTSDCASACAGEMDSARTGEPFWGDGRCSPSGPSNSTCRCRREAGASRPCPSGGWPVFSAWRSARVPGGPRTVADAVVPAVHHVCSRATTGALEVLARKQSEAELREVNRSLLIKEFAIESATSGMALADLPGRISYVNGALAAMLGTPASACVGRLHRRRLSRRHPSEARLVDAGAWRGEVTMPGGAATTRTLEGVANTVCGPTGDPLCRILSFQDVTDRKRMMAEVERSQRLSALSLFAGGVAHDFNNLLGRLVRQRRTRAGRAARRQPGDASPRHRRRGVRTRPRPDAAPADVRDWQSARAPAGVRVLVPATSVVRCRCRARRRRGRSSASAPRARGTCWATRTSCPRSFTNVLVNARQAMPEGRARGAERAQSACRPAAARPTSSGGRYVEVAVTDEGPGIPADVLPHVFEPFYTTKPDGSGLGLAMTYSIVQAHGGRVTALSRDGAGTTMLLLLPAAEHQAEARSAPAPVARTGEPPIAGVSS